MHGSLCRSGTPAHLTTHRVVRALGYLLHNESISRNCVAFPFRYRCREGLSSKAYGILFDLSEWCNYLSPALLNGQHALLGIVAWPKACTSLGTKNIKRRLRHVAPSNCLVRNKLLADIPQLLLIPIALKTKAVSMCGIFACHQSVCIPVSGISSC